MRKITMKRIVSDYVPPRIRNKGPEAVKHYKMSMAMQYARYKQWEKMLNEKLDRASHC